LPLFSHPGKIYSLRSKLDAYTLALG